MCETSKPCGPTVMCVDMPGGRHSCLCPDGGEFNSSTKACTLKKAVCSDYCLNGGSCRWSENSGRKCR